MYVWQPVRYAAAFTCGIALSTWVNAKVNRRNERIRQNNLDSGLSQGGGPSPELFMQRMRSIHESAAVKSAIELGVFSKLGALCRRGYGIGGRPGNAREARTGATTAEMANACECSERGMRVLLDSLASARFLRKRSRVQGSPKYRLTASSAKYLDEDSDMCVSRLADWYFSEHHMDPLLKHLTDSVRRGASAMPQSRSLRFDDPRWLALAKTFGPVEKSTAAAVANAALQGLRNTGEVSVLDVAVGHGMYGIECARRHRGVSVTALGSLSTLEQVAMPNALKAGIVPPGSTPEWVAVGSKATQMKSSGRSRPKPEGYSMSSWSPPGSSERHDGVGRYRLLVGDALEMESWGTGEHDLVLLPHLLHLLDRGTMASVLSKARQALKPDGRCFIVEVVPNEERTDPSTVFSLVMLAHTPGGDAYTLSELRGACADAGFVATEKTAMPKPRMGQLHMGWRFSVLAAFASPPKHPVVPGPLQPPSAGQDRAPEGAVGTVKPAEGTGGEQEEADQAKQKHPLPAPAPLAYPMSLGDFFVIMEEIVRSSLPGRGPDFWDDGGG